MLEPIRFKMESATIDLVQRFAQLRHHETLVLSLYDILHCVEFSIVPFSLGEMFRKTSNSDISCLVIFEGPKGDFFYTELGLRLDRPFSHKPCKAHFVFCSDSDRVVFERRLTPYVVSGV